MKIKTIFFNIILKQKTFCLYSEFFLIYTLIIFSQNRFIFEDLLLTFVKLFHFSGNIHRIRLYFASVALNLSKGAIFALWRLSTLSRRA